MVIDLVIMTNKSDGFYQTMGPFLAKRSIASELGMRVWDDEGKVWFIAKQGDEVLGFSAIILKGKAAWLLSSWVKPQHRGKGIYEKLLTERIAWISEGYLKGAAEMRATCTKMSINSLMRHGFVPIGMKGQYTEVKKGLV